MAYSKGSGAKTTEYAKGGQALGRVRNFMKEPDEFRNPDEGDAAADEDQKYGKEGDGKGQGIAGGAPKPAKDKTVKTAMPRK